MPYEAYKGGLEVYVGCMMSAGVEVRMFETANFGVPTILFGERQPADMSDDAYRTIHGDCANASYFPIETVYRAQPSAVDAIARRVTQYHGALSDCLRKYGVELPGNAGFDETMQLVQQVDEDADVACDVESGFRETQTFPDDFWE